MLSAAQTLTNMTFQVRNATKSDKQQKLFEVPNYYHPERRSSVFVVPGLIGVILTMTMVLVTAVAIVRENKPLVNSANT